MSCDLEIGYSLVELMSYSDNDDNKSLGLWGFFGLLLLILLATRGCAVFLGREAFDFFGSTIYIVMLLVVFMVAIVVTVRR